MIAVPRPLGDRSTDTRRGSRKAPRVEDRASHYPVRLMCNESSTQNVTGVADGSHPVTMPLTNEVHTRYLWAEKGHNRRGATPAAAGRKPQAGVAAFQRVDAGCYIERMPQQWYRMDQYR